MGITERLYLLRLSLQNLTDELGYQGETQQERDAATVLGALDYAIAHDTIASLAKIAREWTDAQIVEAASRQTESDDVPF